MVLTILGAALNATPKALVAGLKLLRCVEAWSTEAGQWCRQQLLEEGPREIRQAMDREENTWASSELQR